MKNFKFKIVAVLLILLNNNCASQILVVDCLKNDTFYKKMNLAIDSFDRTRDFVIMNHIKQQLEYTSTYRIKKGITENERIFYKECMLQNLEQWITLSSKLIKYPNYNSSFFKLKEHRSLIFKKVNCLEQFLEESDGFLSLPKLENIKDTSCYKMYKSAILEKTNLDKYIEDELLLQNNFEYSTRYIIDFLENQDELKNITILLTNDDIKRYYKTENHIVLLKQSLYLFLTHRVDLLTLEKLKVYYSFDKKIPNEAD